MSKKRICKVCGKTYEYCPSCSSDPEYWKVNYCSEGCMNVYLTFNRFVFGHITEDDVKNKLKDVDTSKFVGFYKDKYAEITAEKKDNADKVYDKRANKKK